MSSNGTVLMVGLPGSGKTTFLAALWHQLESGEMPTAFTADRLQRDREYLNAIRDAWLAFKEIPKPSAGIEKSAPLHLRHARTQAVFDLSIPDIAGETFDRQWFDRQLPGSYIDQLKEAFGVLLFVHCRQVTRPEVLPLTRPAAGPQTATLTEWDPRLAPTQVRLVDLVQSVLGVFQRAKVLRVAVIVSAWDQVKETTTPAVWLQRRLPLLDQFLQANGDILSFKIFGVSAIGGSLGEHRALALAPSPSTRVRVLETIENMRDLTCPIEFLMIGEAES